MSRLGIQGFEQLVPEGIPKSAAVLLLVPPAEEKDQLAAQFVLEGLTNGDAAIVVESEVGLRDLNRRLGNMGLDAEKASAEGRLIPLDWAKVVLARNGTPAGVPAIEAALNAAAAAAKLFPGLRVVIDLSGALPDFLASGPMADLATKLARVAKALGGLSLLLSPRAQGTPPAAEESFDVVLDLRPLKPSGIGLAVIAISGTPLPRSHLTLTSVEGRLLLAAAKKAPPPASASVECPVCKSTIPAGAAECPVCKSPRPVRRPGEPEVLDYIEALGQRVGLPGAPLEPAAPPPPPAPPPTGKEGEPARPEPARRGLTNGLARGRRMVSPAVPRGRVNGQGRVNGLASSIVSTRRGMTNGLTNGNGFTNGLGSTRFTSENRLRAWRVWAIPVVAAALLSIPLLFSVDLVEVNTFGIDGSFGEWTVRAPLRTNTSLPGSIDLVSAAVRMDPDRVYGFLQTREPLFPGSPDGAQTDAFRMFVDSDGDARTGYAAEGLGADLLVEIAGARGAVVAATLSSFAGEDAADWSAWAVSEPALVAVGRGGEANRTEFSFPHPTGRNGSSLRAAFESLSFDGREDTSGFALSPNRGTVVVVQRSIAPLNITAVPVDLLELDVWAPLGAPALASLSVSARGTVPVTALLGAALLDETGGTIATAGAYLDGFGFVLSPPRAVPPSGTTMRVSAQVDTAARGTLGLEIASDSDIHVSDATVSLATRTSDRDLTYVGPVPLGVSIDGAYGEWPLPFSDSTREPSTFEDPNIDLAAYDSVLSGGGVAVYAGVVGRLLQGALVPVRNPAVPRAAPLDADRDSVPDSVDPYPNDFNNNGTPDADTNGDFDEDGFKDFGYPGGIDLWLNTTLPPTFPPPYADRPVSVYIGPVQRPVSEDTVRVFIDSDANPATGYAAGAGAEWMVAVAGRHGAIRSQGLFRFIGATPGVWDWAPAGSPQVEVGTRQIELLAILSPAPSVGAQVVIDLRDWRGGSDVAEGGTRGVTRSAEGAHVEAGAYAASMPVDLASPVQVRSDAFTVEWALAEISVDAGAGFTPFFLSAGSLTATESTASYPLRIGGADGALHYAFGPDSIKEQVILAGPPAQMGEDATLRVRFSLSLSAGASLMVFSGSPIERSFGDEGSLAVVVGGQPRARFPAPSAIDADGRLLGCAYSLPPIGSLDIVCGLGDSRGLAYPVAVDPSLVYVLSNTGTYGASGQILGWSVAAGDFDGDGYTDVLAGAPFNNKNGTSAGMAFIYLGPITSDVSSPDVALRGNGSNARAGYAVSAGDFNNDGMDDAVVGQQNGQPTLVFNGRTTWPAFVSAADASFPVPLPNNDNSMGRTLAAGDFNDDGSDDLVIGRPLYTDPANPHGRAYLYFGPFAASEPTPDLTLVPFNTTSSRFSWAMATGRIDSDTKDDLVVGEPTVKVGTSFYGRISFFKGSSLTGSGSKSPDTTTINLVNNAWFGAAVAVGPLDGDTYADVVVGSPQYSSNNGRAYVFIAKSDGSGLGQDQSIDYTFASQTSGEKFGTSLLVLDYSDDGGNDVIVGAETYSTDDGRVYVFNNPLSDQSTPDETLNAASTADDERFGHALAGGKGSNDARSILVVGGPYRDDAGQTPSSDWGRAVVATIPEFTDAIHVAGAAVLLAALLGRRRRRNSTG